VAGVKVSERASLKSETSSALGLKINHWGGSLVPLNI